MRLEKFGDAFQRISDANEDSSSFEMGDWVEAEALFTFLIWSLVELS